MTSGKLKFSILTPSYNSDKYIERAITSVFEQNYPNWEHIIVDGASSDNTLNILEKHSHITWQSAPDSGQSEAMNKAFKLSSGDIIIYLNADDELKKDALGNFAEAFEASPDCDMVIADLEIDISGVKTVNRPAANLGQILNYWPAIFPLNPVSYAYKRELQLAIGHFPLDNHYSMDYWFLLRAFLTASILKLDKVTGTFYFDGTNKSADAQNAKVWLKKVRNDFIRRYFYKPPVARCIARRLLNSIR